MPPATKKVLLNNVGVFDGHGLSVARSVVIDGSCIGDDASDPDEVIDGNGGYLLPGLIDAHVHLHHQGHLEQLAKHGVTSALDMATWPAQKMNSLRRKVGLTDIRSAGLPATAKGSMHSAILPLPDEALSVQPQDAESFVQRRIDEGSDYIKVISDIPGPSQETLSAVTKAAHEKGKKVVAHASSYVPFQMALEAGVDVVTHAPRDKAVDAAMIEKMVADKTASVPTLIMMREVGNPPSFGTVLSSLLKPSLVKAIVKIRRASQGVLDYDNAKQSVSEMYRAGIPVLAGTDCHEEAGSPADVKHGISMHQELELLVDAGLSTVDTLRAATILPARHFGLDDRGSIEPGKRADLVLLRENPLQDIRATKSIERVWCAGVEYK